MCTYQVTGFVYILWSEKLDKYYIGSSVNPDRRLKYQHNKGFVRATANGMPWEVVFKQECNDLATARKIEFKLKRFKSRVIIEKIISDGYCRLIS